MQLLRENTATKTIPVRTHKPIAKERANLLELIHTIPKVKVSALNSHCEEERLHYQYALSLMTHCKEYYPKEFKKLQFNIDTDDVHSFNARLAQILFDDGKFIDFGYNQEAIIIYEPVMENNTVSNVYLSQIEKTKSLPLKVGIAHFFESLMSIDIGIFENFSNIETAKDDEMDHQESEHWELVKFFEDDTQSYKAYLKNTRRLLKQVKKYAQLPLSILKDYKPRSIKNKELKKHLLKALKNPIDIIRKIPETEDYDNGSSSLIEAYILLVDQEHEFDSMLVYNLCRRLGETEANQVAITYTYKGEQKTVSSKKQLSKYKKFIKHHHKVTSLLYNY